jgi:RNA polymerase sigma-70 factor (sigma-E family)
VDEGAFATFAAHAGPGLLRFAFLTCGSEEEAADLTQDALAGAFTHWRRIEQMDSPEAYVRRMIVNGYINAWRRRVRAAAHLERHSQLIHAEPPDEQSRVEDRVVVRDLLGRLPRRQRAAVVLRYYADYSDEAIADVLGCSTATVRSQIARALQKLRVSTVPTVTEGARR